MNPQISEHTKALKAAKDAAAKLTATEQALRGQHAQLTRERTKVDTAEKSLEECVANMERLVDQEASRWAERHARELVHTVGGYREVRARSGGEWKERDVKPQLPRIGDHERGRLGFDDLCGLAPALVKARLAEVIQQSGARFGLPADARRAKLAELDAGISALEAQHTELVDAASEAGIELPLLQAVQERREAEARAQERERELAAQRAAGVHTVSFK